MSPDLEKLKTKQKAEQRELSLLVLEAKIKLLIEDMSLANLLECMGFFALVKGIKELDQELSQFQDALTSFVSGFFGLARSSENQPAATQESHSSRFPQAVLRTAFGVRA